MSSPEDNNPSPVPFETEARQAELIELQKQAGTYVSPELKQQIIRGLPEGDINGETLIINSCRNDELLTLLKIYRRRIGHRYHHPSETYTQSDFEERIEVVDWMIEWRNQHLDAQLEH